MTMFSPRKFLAEIRRRRARRASIRALSALDDRMLQDIGVHRGQIPALVDGLSSAPSSDADQEAPARFDGTLRDLSCWVESYET